MRRKWTDSGTNGGDVLVAPRRRDRTLDDLQGAASRPLAGVISAMCDWGPGGTASRVGDVRFVILDFAVSEAVSVYVQFLTQPGDPVLVETVSGAQHPEIRPLLTAARRRVLSSLGYRSGGEARNYQKEWRVTGPASARGLADELLRVLFDIYGYRGRQPLRVHRESDTRTEAASAFAAVTLDDVRTMASAIGITAAPFDPKHLPARQRRAAAARMLRVDEPMVFYLEMCEPDELGHGRFNGVGLRAGFAGTARVPDARVLEIAGDVPFVRMHRDDDHDVLVFWDLPLKGTTATYFQEALRRWLWVLMKVSSLLEQGTSSRRRGGRTRAKADAADQSDLWEAFDRSAKSAKSLIH